MVPDSIQYGGFWRRVAASVIDTLLLLPVLMLMERWFVGSQPQSASVAAKEMEMLQGMLRTGQLPDIDALMALNEAAAAPTSLADPLINYGLPMLLIVMFWLWRRGTPGKLWLGMQVVDATTLGPLSIGQSIGRVLGYIVAGVPLFLGLLWVGLDPRKQGWHDKLAGTVVIRTPPASTP
jgi:hypothetical protein